MEWMRLTLRSGAEPEKITELIEGIRHQRFRKLQKRLIKDLTQAGFKTLDLCLYMRLGGWSHTGGTYINAMLEVKALCREMFGYEIPEKIGRVHPRDYRYRANKGLTEVWPKVSNYHQKRIRE